MASSGYIDVGVTNYDTLRFYWQDVGQFVESNYTNVYWELQLIAGSNGYISSSAAKAWYVNVNGSEYSGTNTVGIGNNTSKVLASGTTGVGHNADGTKTFGFSFSQEFNINFGGWIGGISGNGSGMLNTIPRASQPSVSMGNVTMGNGVTIYTNWASASFYHTIRFTFNGVTYTLASGVGASYTFYPDLATWGPRLTNAMSLGGIITLDTYSGSTYIGSKQVGLTLTVPSTIVPNMDNPTLTPTSDIVPSGWGYVAGKSKATVAFNNAQGVHGSSIVGYAVNCNGITDNTSPYQTELLNAGDNVVNAIIVDSRGLTKSIPTTVNAYTYAKPSLSNIVCYRSDVNGQQSNSGRYIFIRAKAIFSSCGGNNNFTIKYQHRLTNGSYNTATSMQNDTDTVIGNDLISTTSSYVVKLSITDLLGETSEYEITIPTALTSFHIKSGGKGAAFGKYAEQDNLLDIAWPTKVTGGLTLDELNGNTLLDWMHPVGDIIFSGDPNFNPGSYYGGTWLKITDRVIVGAGGSYANGSTGGTVSNNHQHYSPSGVTTNNQLFTDMGGYGYDYGNASNDLWYMISGSTKWTQGVGAYYPKVSLTDVSTLQPYVAKYIWQRTA